MANVGCSEDIAKNGKKIFVLQKIYLYLHQN